MKKESKRIWVDPTFAHLIKVNASIEKKSIQDYTGDLAAREDPFRTMIGQPCKPKKKERGIRFDFRI